MKTLYLDLEKAKEMKRVIGLGSWIPRELVYEVFEDGKVRSFSANWYERAVDEGRAGEHSHLGHKPSEPSDSDKWAITHAVPYP